MSLYRTSMTSVTKTVDYSPIEADAVGSAPLELRATRISIETVPHTKVFVTVDYAALCEYVANRIIELVRHKPNAVLGLATGSTPEGVYTVLKRRHREENVDCSDVVCFNLDEYYPMLPSEPQSYYRFMKTHLFNDLPCRSWHVPDGRPRSEGEIARDCAQYEAMITSAGGIDLQLLGIGRNGHIGFNEPHSPIDSRMRLVTLDETTRHDATGSFGRDLRSVPSQAVSMGVGTILAAREITLLASGISKAAIVRQALLGPVTESVPASLLQTHPNASFYLDAEAATELTALGVEAV